MPNTIPVGEFFYFSNGVECLFGVDVDLLAHLVVLCPIHYHLGLETVLHVHPVPILNKFNHFTFSRAEHILINDYML